MRGVLYFLVVMCLANPGLGQDPIRFARTPDISPDGKLVAFSYKGDIMLVDAIGGTARPLTYHEAHDYYPNFSPDGRYVAFSSNRYGQYDVFVVATTGGKPKRLTFDSANDFVIGWSSDGKNVLFQTGRTPDYPGNPEIYSIDMNGGFEKKLNAFEAKDAVPNQAGTAMALVKGPGTWYRKGYRGSSNDDIWICNADGTNPKPITTFAGQDTSPMWSPDGQTLYYVTEEADTAKPANIVKRQMGSTLGPIVAVTKHETDMVRRAKISRNGEWIVYECGIDLWVVDTKTGTPRKLAIDAQTDDKSNADKTTVYTKDASSLSVSPDENLAVVVVRGELFLVKLPMGGKGMPLTNSPANDHSPVWNPDGKSVVFISDRSGVEDLYKVEADDAENPEFAKATKFKVTALTNSKEDETQPRFSPKGDRISFIRSGRIWTMKPDGTDAKMVIDSPQVQDYDWSPDGKYFVYSRMDGSFGSEVYIAPVDGSSKPINVTRYATNNGNVNWSRTGGKISFVGNRRGQNMAHILALTKPVAAGSTVSGNDIDWDDIHLRAMSVSSFAVDNAVISPDGTQVALRVNNSGDDLWVTSSDGRSVNRLTTGGYAPRSITWSKRITGMIYFLSGTGEVRTVRTNPFGSFGPANAPSTAVTDPGRINFSCKLTIHRDEEYAQVYAQAWRALSEGFYDKNFHGANWDAVRAKYLPALPHVATKEDLYSLVYLMLGELNASHLGISGSLPTLEEVTADLGLLWDNTYTGPGLKVKDIIARGPADKKGLGLKAGDVVLAIDKIELNQRVNVSQLLNGKVGEVVRLDVTDKPADSKTRRKVELVAVDRSRISNLMYDRWVKSNTEAVAKASGGRLGYIHIPSMNEAGLEVFVRSLYSDMNDKEGVIIDVRFNGGGFTHDMVMNYLVGKEHTRFVQRTGNDGFVLRNTDRKWAKPMVVMMNNRSYSDAEIFPHAFRASGLGRLVGQATGGHVIGTTATTLIDGSTLRMPRTGVFTNTGVNMDKQGVQPDVAVDITPEDWAKGIDTQLNRAVLELDKDVLAWKKAKGLPGTSSPPAKGP